MTSKLDPVASIQFIFSECQRLHERMLSGEKVIPNSSEAMEFFYRIPHPENSRSFLVCGRQADECLRVLAQRAASHAGIAHQVSTASVREKLGEIIVRKFLKEKRPIDRKNVDRAFSEATKLASTQRRTITHYIPCHLMLRQNPDEFTMGPVRFRTRSSFRKDMLPRALAFRHEAKRHRSFLYRTIKYYKSFPWVAEITVPNCDKPTSKETAARAVSSALDCLHMLLEPRYTHKMSIGGPDRSQDWRGNLAYSEEGGLEYSWGYESAGSVAFEEDWFERFSDAGYARALHLCGVALEIVVNPALHRPLSRRFLDAALWFGEAVREQSAAAKVVKFATALERMVMTDEKKDITSLMSRRVASLCCSDPRDSFQSWLTDAQQLYCLRSKLVHGSLSPQSAEILYGIRLGAKLGEATLLSTLLAFDEIGLKDENVGQKKLANWFNSVVSHVLSAATMEPQQGGQAR